ncbi:MAG: DUF6923 family protein [Clostridium sp.]
MTPFNCSSFAYLFGSSIYQLDLATGQGTSIATITPANSFNAVGFYLADGYMYGYDITTNQIAKLGKDGDLQDLFSVTNLPAQAYNIADIDDNGYYYFSIGASTTMYVVDLNPLRPATYGKLVDANTKALSTTGTTMTGSMGGAVIGTGDWAFSPIDGQLYYVKNSDGIVRKVNPLTGVITQLTTSSPTTGVYGGVFFGPDGAMYAYDSSSGNVFKYAISGTNATKSTFSSPGTGVSFGDGARCKYAPIYFATIEDPPVKTASPYKNVGETITYTIVVNNIGNIDADLVNLIDTLPVGTTFINNSLTLDGIAKNGNPNPPSGIGIGTLSVGVHTITFLATAISIPTPNPTVNNGSFTYNYTDTSTSILYNGTANSTSASTTIVDLTITSVKTVDIVNAMVNDILTYTIVFTGTGNVTTSNLTFIDTIPNGTQYVAGSLKQDGANISGTPNPPGVTLTNQISGGEVSTVTFQVKVVSIPTPNPIPNIQTLGYSYTSDPTTSTVKSKSESSNTVLTAVNDPLMSSSKSLNKDFAQLGDTITYTIVLTNAGSVSSDNVILRDTIPNFTTFVTDSLKINGAVQTGVIVDENGVSIPTINASTTTTITFDVVITTLPNPNPIINNANITYSYTAITTIPNGASGVLNTNSVTTTVTQAIMSISKDVDFEYAKLGDTITYTIEINNTGNVAGTVRVIDTIPLETTFVANSLQLNGATQGGATILPPTGFNVGTINSNGIATITFKVVVLTLPTSSIIYNDGFLSYNYTEYPTIPNGRNKNEISNIVQTTIISASVILSKSVDHTYSTCGSTISYTVEAINTGNEVIRDAVFIDTLPLNLQFITNSVFVNGANVIGANPEVGVNVGNINNGEIVTITFITQVLCI